ncbi:MULTISPECIES: hypothetical protein [unclassified Nocardioides]|uniref:hypothetical protein n=1 Tax=unclassified Nocardioides TaxID=2615069 RepID=UPI0009F0B1E0|nr:MULTISPECIES: hypothetical protein [unclassified Nocardioides]GAW47936.1 Sodium/proline symporter [Nocardioides sp. PD653-B2]GAW53761.1 Sodium/proline symporter [Nocardioides sp. PD653]
MITGHKHGLPDGVSIVAMLLGACSAYTAVGFVGMRVSGGLDHLHAPLISSPFVVATANFLTLLSATGICGFSAWLLQGDHWAWLATGLLGTGTYLLGISLQAYVISLWLGRR